MNQASGDFSPLIQESGNLPFGIVMGLGAALVGAALWAVLTVLTGYQIGWMAVGVGLLVGFAIRQFGKGSRPVFGIVGAVVALAGCLAGNLLAVAGYLARDTGTPFFETLGYFNLQTSFEVLKDTASPIDFLFYAIAVYEGYKLSILPAPTPPVAEVESGA